MRPLGFNLKTSEDLFKSWYPRWGTEDIYIVLNGIYNRGISSPHDNNAKTWTDLVTGKEIPGYSSTTAAPLWEENCMAFDDVKRSLAGSLDMSDSVGYTIEMTSYNADVWGILAIITYGYNNDKGTTEFIPYSINTGVTVNCHKSRDESYVQYTHKEPNTFNDLCITYDSEGWFRIYNNGEEVVAKVVSDDIFSAIRRLNRLVVGGTSSGDWPPTGSKLYGMTIYKSALSPKEVHALYKANIKNYKIRQGR